MSSGSGNEPKFTYAKIWRSELFTWAVKNSSGDLSYGELKQRNYPYGVTTGRGIRGRMYGGQARFINKHSNVFASSWNFKVDNSGFTLMNTAPYANLLFEGIPGLTVPRNFFTSAASIRELKAIEKRGMKVLIKNMKDLILYAFDN